VIICISVVHVHGDADGPHSTSLNIRGQSVGQLV
jgi:hypothetical protein